MIQFTEFFFELKLQNTSHTDKKEGNLDLNNSTGLKAEESPRKKYERHTQGNSMSFHVTN